MEEMKKRINNTALALLLTLSSCVEDMNVPCGWITIEPPVKVEETRSAPEIDYLVSISRGSSIIMAPTRYSMLEGSITLPTAADYMLTAESCTRTEAESLPSTYGQPRYAGTKAFAVNTGQSTTVSVRCSMDNAAFQLLTDDSFYYTQYEVTATVGNRTVTLSDTQTMAYFNVDDTTGEAILSYHVTATTADGEKGTSSGQITLKRRNLSRLTLKAIAKGQIGIQIAYDDTFTPIVTEITLEE